MRAGAAQVGVSAMTPYRYFEDKADLLGAYAAFSAARTLSGVNGTERSRAPVAS